MEGDTTMLGLSGEGGEGGPRRRHTSFRGWLWWWRGWERVGELGGGGGAAVPNLPQIKSPFLLNIKKLQRKVGVSVDLYIS